MRLVTLNCYHAIEAGATSVILIHEATGIDYEAAAAEVKVLRNLGLVKLTSRKLKIVTPPRS